MSRPRGACVLTERGSTATWLFIGACHRSMHRTDAEEPWGNIEERPLPRPPACPLPWSTHDETT